ncbi:2-polyprenyl-6-methoxyphenol hydroxylase-like FAD-dependent oxidoreductase [Prauserella shujinwangii]|uniref:2-polyprenyl-6-methoxyphenol hydroxylase-like FAD-dependent oxidoreductase n=1 Tax=Prauserella shujinwangii TaxID=1453103 RepID=A0A2T0LT92_9PSEU|nr:FAD-dependent monooxygenase [Prauserella shujinwangii]PRX46962.1 2-polyprenyl-6-methoxyphenol hydroxylase-like FAD-dependent oxidoreductase [Prauserella shujinwangii]
MDEGESRRHGTSERVPVVVAGAGPVGAVLALELARHGVRSVVVDKTTGPSRHPKMDYLNGRSMEFLRRLGLATVIRERGVDPRHPFNFVWSRDFQEPPIAVWNYPSAAELTRRIESVNDGSVPVEAHQRVQGSLLEDILRQRMRSVDLVDFREGWELVDLREGDDDVTVELRATGGAGHRSVRAGYLAGCDGANSTVRQRLGVSVAQYGPTTLHRDVYFRSTDPVLRRHGRAFLTIAAGGLTLVSRDEDATWTGTVHLADDRVRALDPVDHMRQCLGADFRVDEVLDVVEWEGRLAVSESYRSGRVFLAGDAAHQFYPTGGHGANTGIGDAVDLGWKLAALVHGWGGPGLPASYERERRPVALFNREMCANLLEVWLRFPRLVADGASREHIAGFLEHETYQMDNLGIHFGYRYSSPLIRRDDEDTPPPWRWNAITASTWPGGRAPSVQLADGTALFDLFDSGLTLVDFSADGTGAELVKRAERRRIPVKHLAIDDDHVRRCWERDLVLVRPDQHVAWRGDRLPRDCDDLLDAVTGGGGARA